MVDGRATVQGRLILQRYNLAEKQPEHGMTDALLKRHLREMFTLLNQCSKPAAAARSEG
jgi:hypothetical protein